MYRVAAPPARLVALDALAPRGWLGRAAASPIAAHLGERALVTPRGYVALDGTRRVRFVAGDDDARLEALDPARGLTLESRRSRARALRPALADERPRAVWHARVLGRVLAPVCFGARRVARDPQLVRVAAYADGVLVVRLAANGADAGDTWHPSLEGALAQLRYELGAHLGALREGDHTRPWRREPAWTGACWAPFTTL
ncbi:MAG: hypothetical protein KF729_34955 [Sandaracinaceae bacterium]|nr:hypothetical protein [Sandaracinaceae bacterium]